MRGKSGWLVRVTDCSVIEQAISRECAGNKHVTGSAEVFHIFKIWIYFTSILYPEFYIISQWLCHAQSKIIEDMGDSNPGPEPCPTIELTQFVSNIYLFFQAKDFYGQHTQTVGQKSVYSLFTQKLGILHGQRLYRISLENRSTK